MRVCENKGPRLEPPKIVGFPYHENPKEVPLISENPPHLLHNASGGQSLRAWCGVACVNLAELLNPRLPAETCLGFRVYEHEGPLD